MNKGDSSIYTYTYIYLIQAESETVKQQDVIKTGYTLAQYDTKILQNQN